MDYIAHTLPNGLRMVHLPVNSPVSYCGFAVNAGTRDENEDEFGWENVFEFKRWFQLVRTEKVDEAIGKNPAIGARLNANKENYLFPIPVRQCELRGWKNNPGY